MTCVLCGITGRSVRHRLIAWKQPVGTERYTVAPRCDKSSECKERAEANGDPWDTRDPLERAPERHGGNLAETVELIREATHGA